MIVNNDCKTFEWLVRTRNIIIQAPTVYALSCYERFEMFDICKKYGIDVMRIANEFVGYDDTRISYFFSKSTQYFQLGEKPYHHVTAINKKRNAESILRASWICVFNSYMGAYDTRLMLRRLHKDNVDHDTILKNFKISYSKLDTCEFFYRFLKPYTQEQIKSINNGELLLMYLLMFGSAENADHVEVICNSLPNGKTTTMGIYIALAFNPRAMEIIHCVRANFEIIKVNYPTKIAKKYASVDFLSYLYKTYNYRAYKEREIVSSHLHFYAISLDNYYFEFKDPENYSYFIRTLDERETSKFLNIYGEIPDSYDRNNYDISWLNNLLSSCFPFAGRSAIVRFLISRGGGITKPSTLWYVHDTLCRLINIYFNECDGHIDLVVRDLFDAYMFLVSSYEVALIQPNNVMRMLVDVELEEKYYKYLTKYLNIRSYDEIGL